MHHHTLFTKWLLFISWRVGLSSSGSLPSKGWPLHQGMHQHSWPSLTLRTFVTCWLDFRVWKSKLNSSTHKYVKGTFTNVTTGPSQCIFPVIHYFSADFTHSNTRCEILLEKVCLSNWDVKMDGICVPHPKGTWDTGVYGLEQSALAPQVT